MITWLQSFWRAKNTKDSMNTWLKSECKPRYQLCNKGFKSRIHKERRRLTNPPVNQLKSAYTLFIFVYECLCVSVPHTYWCMWGPERATDTLELEVQMVMSCQTQETGTVISFLHENKCQPGRLVWVRLGVPGTRRRLLDMIQVVYVNVKQSQNINKIYLGCNISLWNK